MHWVALVLELTDFHYNTSQHQQRPIEEERLILASRCLLCMYITYYIALQMHMLHDEREVGEHKELQLEAQLAHVVGGHALDARLLDVVVVAGFLLFDNLIIHVNNVNSNSRMYSSNSNMSALEHWALWGQLTWSMLSFLPLRSVIHLLRAYESVIPLR